MPRQKRDQHAPITRPASTDHDIAPEVGLGSEKKATSQPNSPAHKRQRTSVTPISRSSSITEGSEGPYSSEIGPPPLASQGGTIVAQNPFDDFEGNKSTTNTVYTSVPRTTQGPVFNSMMQPTSQVAVLPQKGQAISGKVYPANQPMIFNPQNPNAPPIYPCGICHKEVHDNDQAILCESGCNFWFHRVCTGLTEGAYFLLTAEVYAEWVCDRCLSVKDIPLVKVKP